MWKRTGGQVVGALQGTFEFKASGKLANCGTWILVREFLETGRTTFARANWCQQPKLCPGCAHQRARKMLRAYVPRVFRSIAEDDVLPHLVTLTVPNGPDLRERVGVLLGALAQADKRRVNGQRSKRAETEFRKVRSAVWHLEIKRGSGSGEWHPHLHGLVLRPRSTMFDLDAFHAEWSSLTGGRHRPDVRLTRFGRAMLHHGWTGPEAVEKAPDTLCKDLREVFKYCVKFGELAPADVVQVWRETRQVKFVRPWGELRSAVVDSTFNDDSRDPGAYIDWRFAWEAGGYRFQSRADFGRMPGEEDSQDGDVPSGPEVDSW